MRLLPPPVGATRRSRPDASNVSTASRWPGRKAGEPSRESPAARWRPDGGAAGAGRRAITLLRVPLLPLGEDAVAVLRRPFEVVRIDGLGDVLGQALGPGGAGQGTRREVLQIRR